MDPCGTPITCQFALLSNYERLHSYHGENYFTLCYDKAFHQLRNIIF